MAPTHAGAPAITITNVTSSSANASANIGAPYAQKKKGSCLAAIMSFIIPGLGQLLNGHIGKAIGHFILCTLLWFVLCGWIIHIYSAWDASKG